MLRTRGSFKRPGRFYLRQDVAADGALVLLAKHPHPSGALVADGVITVADGVDVHVLEAHHAGIIVDAHRLVISGIRLGRGVLRASGVGHSGSGSAVVGCPGR